MAANGGLHLGTRHLGRGHDQLGASLAEFALILPIFALLLFGLIDFGVVYSNTIALRSGVREGARIAAVNNEGSSAPTCTKNAGAPAFPDNFTGNLVCLTRSKIGLNVTTEVDVSFPNGGTPAVGDPAQITAKVCAKSTTGLTKPFLSGKSVSSSTQIRLEQTPSFTAYSDAAISC
jgi:Flp pilus assembly protein TadG